MCPFARGLHVVLSTAPVTLGTVAASVLVNFMVSFTVALSVVPRVSVMSMLTTRCCAMSGACVCGVRRQSVASAHERADDQLRREKVWRVLRRDV